MIARPFYLEKLIRAKGNGFPKVITGLRRCGKSYLLGVIFVDYLKSQGVDEKHILVLELDDALNAKYRDPLNLLDYVIARTEDEATHYVILDEIQEVYSIVNPELTGGIHRKAMDDDEDIISFVDVILALSRRRNIDVYVTGSNSRMLSNDIVTQFRDKATNISMAPLSFSEFHLYSGGSEEKDYAEYALHGGMPLAVLKSRLDKEEYLKGLFQTTYFKDVLEHHHFRRSDVLEETCNVVCQTIGQLQNAERIANRIRSVHRIQATKETISDYLDAMKDAFLIAPADRYDLKGGSLIGGSRKYYLADVGLRNARLSFAFPDQGQIMENIIFNELRYHGYSVSVGSFDSIEKDGGGNSVRKTYEVDFLAVKGGESIYVQACYSLFDAETLSRETRPYDLLRNSLRKVIVTKDPLPKSKTANGYEIIGITEFLLSIE